MCLSSFPQYNKIPAIIDLQKEKDYFGSLFEGFQSMTSQTHGSSVFGMVPDGNDMKHSTVMWNISSHQESKSGLARWLSR